MSDDKAKLIVLDIETFRTLDAELAERVQDDARNKRPAQNTLKDLKTLWDTEAAREERAAEALARTALDPALATVIVASAQADDLAETWSMQWPVGTGFRDLLADFAEWLGNVSGPRTIWAGHNIEGFDLPVLLSCWQRHRIMPPAHFPVFSGRWRGWVYDTMVRFPSKTPYVSLVDACAAFGIAAKSVEWKGEPMTGARVADAYREGEHDLLAEYCRADVVAERALYEAMTFGGRWGTYGTSDEGLAVEIATVRASCLSEGQKAISILTLLERAGLVPSAA
jgi:hypothetical protein